jgi:hypothetical protein
VAQFFKHQQFPINIGEALKRQKFTHLREPSHKVERTKGILIFISSFSIFCGVKKRWPFGSSTSQSKYIDLAIAEARLTATNVLPVPPLPLKTAIFIN